MTTAPPDTDLHQAVRRLGLHGLLARWEEVRLLDWLPRLVDYEQAERQRRSLDRRLRFARLGPFKPLCDFDRQWPKKIDRLAIEELTALEFLPEAANVVLIGPNGTGKTMIAQNLAHQALLAGHRVRFTTASAMLNDLVSEREIKHESITTFDRSCSAQASPSPPPPPQKHRGSKARTTSGTPRAARSPKH